MASDWSKDIEDIARYVESRNCALFLGAGIGCEARLPSGQGLAKQLALMRGRSHTGEDLQTVAKWYTGKEAELRSNIQKIILGAQEKEGPSSAHLAIARMHDKIRLVLTTNWDQLLEQAYKRAGRVSHYHHPLCAAISSDEMFGLYDESRVNIIKLHGDIGQPNTIVVLQEDYAQYASTHKSLTRLLQTVLETKYLVVIGYSLRDWNFLQACEDTVLRDTGPKGIYVVDPSPSEDTIKFWQKRNADFIRLPAEEFLERLYAEVSGFADREDELKLADPTVAPPERTRVVEFYGPPGMGKSVLLEEIARRHKAEGIQPIFIDFGERKYQYKKKSRENIRSSIADSFGIDIEDSDDELVKGLADKKVLLLFDHTEKAFSGLLEDWLAPLIMRLLDTCDVRVVFAGRAQLGWRRPFGFKSRVRPERLRPFTVDWTKDQIVGTWPSGEGLYRELHELSYGHPLCNRYLIEYLREADVDGDWIKRNKNRLVKRLVRDVIRRTIMKGLSKDIVAAMEIMCVFRVFDIGILRHVLPNFLPQRFGNYQMNDHMELLGNLEAVGLVNYISSKGYYIDTALRKFLALNMQLTNKDQFVKLNETAVTRYDDIVHEGGKWCFVERLYHSASVSLARGEKREAIGEALAQELAMYLERSCRDISDAWVFKKELEQDTGFAEDVPEVYDRLCEVVDRFLERPGTR